VTILRGALSVLLTVFAVFLTAGPAMAHTALKGSDPAEGASLSSAPEMVTLTFGEAVSLPADPINVTGPDGSSWIVGTTTVTGASVTAPVQAVGPSGPCTLNYTVIADDGDEVKGSVRFTLTAAATATAGEAAPATVSAATAVATAAAEPAPRPPAARAAGRPGGCGSRSS
jgi:methionine-rich copper-binding protein CopC